MTRLTLTYNSEVDTYAADRFDFDVNILLIIDYGTGSDVERARIPFGLRSSQYMLER